MNRYLKFFVVGAIICNLLGGLLLGYDPPFLVEMLIWFLNPAGWILGGGIGLIIARATADW